MKKLDKLGVMAQEGKKFKASYDGEAEEIEEYQEDEDVVLTFPEPGGFDGDIVRLELMTFGYSPEFTPLVSILYVFQMSFTKVTLQLIVHTFKVEKCRFEYQHVKSSCLAWS